MKVRNLLIIFITLVLILSYNSIAFAKQNYTQDVVKKVLESKETEFIDSIQNETKINGNNYILLDYNKTETKSDNIKLEKYESEAQQLSSKSEEYLKTVFSNTYEYDDNEFKGTLILKDFNIQVINNGYSESIDTKLINLSNISSNDLYDIEKTKKIDEKIYTLINVDWKPIKTEVIDEQEVPTMYDGIATYQTIIRIKNADTYNVSANYEGTVERTDKLYEYILTYEKEESIPIIPIVIIGAGIFVIAIIFLMNLNNSTLYVFNEKNIPVKLKSFKIKPNMLLDITTSKIKSNNYMLIIKESVFSNVADKIITIKINGNSITLPITKTKITFNIY